MAPLLHDGLAACSGQFFLQLPDDLLEKWQEETMKYERRYSSAIEVSATLLTELGGLQFRPILAEGWAVAALFPQPQHHRLAEAVAVYYPYDTQGKKADAWAAANGTEADSSRRHFMRYRWHGIRVEHRHRLKTLHNALNNHALQGIIEKEWLEGGTSHTVIAGQRIETVAPTLAMLIAIITTMKTMLGRGVIIWSILDIGIMLRGQGDKVDFVKLQTWIEKLRLTRVAQLVGNVLTCLLGFSADEVPFMKTDAGTDTDVLASDMVGGDRKSAARYARYCPAEGLSSIVASITHSLGNVEE